MELSYSNIKKFLIYSFISGNLEQILHISWNGYPKKASYISENGTFQLTLEKISFIFSKESFSYISGNRNPEIIVYTPRNGTFLYLGKPWKKLLIFQGATFRARKMQNTHSEKTSYIFGEKISCTLVLLVILFTQKELFKQKREISFSFLSAAVLNLNFMNSSLFFFCFDWLWKGFGTNHRFFHEKQK